MVDAIVLAEGCLGEEMGKTANGLVLHSIRDRICCVIDSTRAGLDAGEVVAGEGRELGIPVVASFEEAVEAVRELQLGEGGGAGGNGGKEGRDDPGDPADAAPGPSALYLGAATVGGVLPEAFVRVIEQALEAGMTVYNGGHAFLADDPRFAAVADRNGGRIVDVRRPPADDELRVADGSVLDSDVPRVLVMGTDCAVGKRVTAVELVREAERRGIDCGFVATGQTGCMLGPDAGCVVDAVPSDFVAGQVERMVCDVAGQDRDLVVAYGQASVLHPAYSAPSLGILHGAAPHAVVLQHDPVRTRRVLFDHPAYRIAPVEEEIDLIERLGTGKVVAVAVNGKDVDDVPAAADRLAHETGLPAADPLAQREGPRVLLDAVLEHLAKADVWPGAADKVKG